MKRVLISLSLVASLAMAGATAVEWGFDDKKGPANWGDLAPEFHICKTGANQSPVNLTDFIEADLAPLKINYTTKSESVVNKGTTVQVNFAKGSSFSTDGETFNLIQYHFHTPSENHINGKSYPMEVHFVHASDKGELAVIAVMFEEGKANSQLQVIVDNMPMKKGDENSLEKVAFNPLDLLPADKDYYKFNGSLTTPPCSEGVRWQVMKAPVEMSKEQLAAFSKVMGQNNRPVLPLNARKVMQ
ncbi:MAG: carbonic anhydrase [Sulfurovum sp.]|nr:MAG: carbonic anhydrase [Sulfurovum sp.]